MVKTASAARHDLNYGANSITDTFINPSIIPFPANEDNYTENNVIDIQEPKKMLFKFNKPVKLEFS